MSGEPTIRQGELLARHTSLKVGGPADAFSVVDSKEHVAWLLDWAHARGLSVRFIGGGTNLLTAEAGVEGLVVKLQGGQSRVVEQDGEPVLVVGAGVTLASVARRVSKDGFGGLEWAANVPGTVGGAVVNNAGAFGGDTASALVAATVVLRGGELRRMGVEQMEYAYRTSVLKRRELGAVAVIEAELRVRRSTPAVAVGLVGRYQAQRTRSQPRQLSAGSVFANPAGDYSGRLIESVGLKGRRIGGAEISVQHANFIVNVGGATAADVYALVRLAQQTVFDRSGVWLRPEIELFGRWTTAEREALERPEAAVVGQGGGR